MICWSMKITKNSGGQKVGQLELVLEDTNPLQEANDPALISKLFSLSIVPRGCHAILNQVFKVCLMR